MFLSKYTNSGERLERKMAARNPLSSSASSSYVHGYQTAGRYMQGHQNMVENIMGA